jgi:ATP-dependent DNA helicase RecG
VREAVVNAIAHKNYASGAPIQIRVYDDKISIADTCVLPEGWSVDDLLGPHASEPHNPKIANAFFLAGFVESWGRGVQKIFTECKLDGIYPPAYTMAGGSLVVELTAPEDRVIRTSGRIIGTNDSNTSSNKAGESEQTRTTSAIPGQLPPNLAELGGTWQRFSEFVRVCPSLSEFWDELTETERITIQYLAEHGPTQPRDLADAVGITPRSQQRLNGHLEKLGLITSSGQGRAKRYFINVTNPEGGQ